METSISPNAPIGTATEHTAVTPLDTTIAEKMAVMREQSRVARNLPPIAEETATGTTAEAQAEEPVAPDNVESIIEPEDGNTEDPLTADADSAESPSEVNSNTTSDELIDFIEFANDHPNAKFKFTRNGKEVVIDAKKAAAILGQGSAIHEEARELKVQRAEFEEYLNEQRAHHEGLSLAMEFTIQPRIKQAYDEIAKTQGYQATFKQQLQHVQDPAERARIIAAIEQNERYIQQQGETVRQLKPRIDQFKQMRHQQVVTALEQSRKTFKDKDLKNSYVFNEIRDKLARDWTAAKTQIVPGVDNLDLVSSDEHLLGLIRDGLKFRDRPKSSSTQAGASIAALTGKRSAPGGTVKQRDELSQLRDQANKGDRKAAQNLLEARMAQIRASRK